jgi:hypothetical protein
MWHQVHVHESIRFSTSTIMNTVEKFPESTIYESRAMQTKPVFFFLRACNIFYVYCMVCVCREKAKLNRHFS